MDYSKSTVCLRSWHNASTRPSKVLKILRSEVLSDIGPPCPECLIHVRLRKKITVPKGVNMCLREVERLFRKLAHACSSLPVTPNSVPSTRSTTIRAGVRGRQSIGDGSPERARSSRPHAGLHVHGDLVDRGDDDTDVPAETARDGLLCEGRARPCERQKDGEAA